jgi:peptidoglycan hydrolase-like protein with peptidoglycan-binding domain
MNTSVTSPVLSKGSQGAAVKELQTLINRYVGTPSIGGAIAVDGIFGSATETRVKMAQFRYLLKADGIVGPQTWQALRTNAAPVTAKAILRQGSTGSDVEIVQNLLKQIGLYKSAMDQVFGKNTEAAVREYQRINQLQVDGVVGAKTWKILESTAIFLTFD